MLIDVPFDTCIVCRQKEVGDPEHIFPEALGGTLESRILCNKCNHTFGSELVTQVINDPRIQIALTHVRHRETVPYRVRKQQRLIAIAPTGEAIKMPYNKKSGAFECRTQELKDGSIFGPMIDEHRDIPVNESKKYPDGRVVFNRKIEIVQPDMSADFADDRFAVLGSYEFLSLFLGQELLEPKFDPVRDYIEGKKNDHVKTMYMSYRPFKPLHYIRVSNTPGKLLVSYGLFETLIYNVEFVGVTCSIPNFGVLQHLELGKVLFSPDALSGQYYEIETFLSMIGSV